MKEIALSNNKTIKYYTPKELKEHLDKYIIGQDDAKKVLCVAVYNHYKRILLSHQTGKSIVDKSNVLIAGPTGCGKSAMIKCLAHYMGVPCYIADATTLTQAGYVGDDVECVISGLLREAKWDMQMAQYGIIAIDEIDKIAKRSSNQSITRDVVGEGVQQALLKMVEGDKIGVPPQQGRKHPDQQLIYVDTRNIMFIGMGAFSGIEDIIKGRMNMNKIGYCVEDKVDIANNDDFEPFDYMSQEDLRQFGMIPEFIGRFPIVTNVRHLKKEDLVKILTEPKNSIIKQYQNMMFVDGIELTVSDGALSYIAEIALKLEVGARGLKSLVESVMNEFVFEYAGNEEIKELKITKRHVEANINKRFSNYLNVA